MMNSTAKKPETSYPLLYSFRRCPYAIRARLAVYAAGLAFELREVDLKNRPAEMIEISPKATVPVLHLDDGRVIDESLDVMTWALEENDPEGWLDADRSEMDALIARNDGPFKKALDRYKYPVRFPEEDCSGAHGEGLEILADFDKRIAENGFLVDEKPRLADYAIFPFVRQFAKVDMDDFRARPLPALQKWLDRHIESALFKAVMKKNDPWTPGNDPKIITPNVSAAT